MSLKNSNSYSVTQFYIYERILPSNLNKEISFNKKPFLNKQDVSCKSFDYQFICKRVDYMEIFTFNLCYISDTLYNCRCPQRYQQQNVYQFKLHCHKTWFISSLCCSILTLNSTKLCAYITDRFLTVKKRSILFNLIIRRKQNQFEHNTTDVDLLSMDGRDVSNGNYRRLLI